MKPTGHLLTLALCLLTALVTAAAPRKFTLQSPSGTLRVEVAAADSITYRLYHGDDLMLGDSPLSLTIGDGRVLGAGDRLSGTSRRSADEKIVTPIYRKQSIEDKYNELTLRFKEYNVIFRAYDSGMAYRFETTGRKPFTVVSERPPSGFRPTTRPTSPMCGASAAQRPPKSSSGTRSKTNTCIRSWSACATACWPSCPY